MRSTLSILAVLATTALAAGDILPRDACVDACNAKWDTCRAAPDANRASCAADFAACVGYNPFESGTFVPPTTCAAAVPTTAPTAAPSPSAAPACVTACNTAYDACRSKPDANRATCAADYAGCLGYNPFDGSGSLVAPTGCVVVAPSSSAMKNGTASPSKTMMPQPPAATTKPVQVAGAGSVNPAMAMALLAGVGAVAFL